MLSIILPRWAEPKVIHLTQENLQRELNQVVGSELLVTDDWGEGIAKCRTEFISLVEPDCLVNSGYFSSLTGLFKKNKQFRQLGAMGSSVGVTSWHNRIFGYDLGAKASDGVMPVREKKSIKPYNQGVIYIPGAVLRVSTLKRILKDNDSVMNYTQDLVYFSTKLSLEMWRHKCYVSINPNTTYVTTEDYVGDRGKFDPEAGDLAQRFQSTTFRIDK